MILSSANALNLVKGKILSFGKELIGQMTSDKIYNKAADSVEQDQTVYADLCLLVWKINQWFYTTE